MDVTEQSDPTLNRDDPADLVAPTTPEQPTIRTTRTSRCEDKKHRPSSNRQLLVSKTNDSGVYSEQDVKPNDKFEISIDQPKNWQGSKTASNKVLEIAKGKWVRSIDAKVWRLWVCKWL